MAALRREPDTKASREEERRLRSQVSAQELCQGGTGGLIRSSSFARIVFS
jgi:hypothetical protein